jgi:putative membrane protein
MTGRHRRLASYRMGCSIGRPVTLVLRLLAPGTARRGLLAALRMRLIGWLTHPVIAGALSVGGLWVLYRTPLFAAADERPWLHALVHLHVLVSGLVFMVAVTRLEPLRTRYALPLRIAVLVLTGAAHNVLARSLYTAPPPGMTLPAGDLHAGAELMYYGGDVVDIALVTVLALQWYAAGGRQLRRERRRVAVRAV